MQIGSNPRPFDCDYGRHGIIGICADQGDNRVYYRIYALFNYNPSARPDIAEESAVKLLLVPNAIMMAA
jgi:hypothetical protein